jgi:D-hexose-6-phosphate mutarotase
MTDIQTIQRGELTFVQVENAYASALICLQGAQLCSYKSHSKKELLFVSSAETYQQGQAIRGGIPVCWPWFGDHPSDKSQPAHGLVRNINWHYLGACDTHEGTELEFQLSEQDIEFSQFPWAFKLNLKVMVGDRLTLSLTTTNQAEKNMPISEALHSYFQIEDIHQVNIEGLEGINYYNKVSDSNARQGSAKLQISEETDHVYHDFEGVVGINAPGQRLTLLRQNSRSLVVWNPWQLKARQLSHFNASDYLTMLCVETANAMHNRLNLAPGESHQLKMTIIKE